MEAAFCPTANAWRIATLIILAYILNVAAQVSQVDCVGSFAWLKNSKGQSPCLVAAYLDGACSSDPADWTVEALTGNEHYTAPTIAGATPCQCNTVSYSLLSACAYCQPGNLNLPWSGWKTNCSTSFVAEYPRPIPPGTAVPAWAYHNVTDIDTWNASIAEAIANVQIPDSTALPNPTSSSALTSSGFSTAALTSSSPSGTGSGSSSAGSALNPTQSTMTVGATSSKDVGTIVGGVLGGTALLAIIVLAVVMRAKYSRISKQPASITYSAGNPPYTSSNWTSDMREKPLPLDSPLPAIARPRAYDPNDPSTFPSSLTSLPTQTTHQSGVYGGRPEV